MGIVSGQQGVSIIAVVFLIIVVAFLGVIVVSLVSTHSFRIRSHPRSCL